MLIVQERISFRGLPLTPWTNHVIEAGSGEEIEQLPSPGRLLEAAASAQPTAAGSPHNGTWETGAPKAAQEPQVAKMDVALPVLFLDGAATALGERAWRRKTYSGGLQLLHLDQFAYGEPPEAS